MDNRRSPHDNRLSHSSTEWRLSSVARPISYPPRDENGEIDWNSDWLTDGVAVHLQALNEAGASTTHPSTRGDPYIRTNSYGEAQRNFYDAHESIEEAISLERRDSRTSLEHDQWLDVPKQHEAVTGLIHSNLSQRHAPSPDGQIPRTRRMVERVAPNNLKRMSRSSSKILRTLPGLDGSTGSADSPPLHGHELEKRTSRFSERLKTASSDPPAGDPTLVMWDGPGDLENPMNWPRRKKWLITFAMGSITFCVTLASSIFSPGTEQAAREFGVSPEVMVLATALFILGFAFGPLIGLFMFAIFQIPVALAPNLATLLVFRFLSGFFGCSPLAIVGGAFADFWAPVDRGVAASIFSGATFLGPTLGPLIGGFVAQNPNLTWRWTAWITLFLVAPFGTICWLVYDESLGPVLLQRRARRLRHETKNWAFHAPADEIEVSMEDIFKKYLTKPIMMLIWEPILLLVTIYISFIYGILYLFFETYPISFVQQRGWSLGAGGLPFIAVMIGVSIGCVINYMFIKTRYRRILKQHGRVAPEERLVPMMVGSVLLPIGLFWFAWSSNPKISWVPQVLAGIPAGAGILLIFLQGLNYIIDVYKMYSNSAIAGNTIIRSLFGAGFPMFAIYMYRDLGVPWATSVLGFISIGLIPVPILFFVYGARIRKMSKFTPKM